MADLKRAAVVIIGLIILGIGLVLGPFGVPGDVAGIALISGAGAEALKHGK